MPAWIGYLPGLNAILISASGLSVLVGVRCIRRGRRRQHMWSMLTATGLALLFLVFYLLRVSLTGTNAFHGPPGLRYLYFAILFSHMAVALISTPLVLMVLGLARRQQFSRHKRFARWTVPLWLYVSVTGVLVYLLLYHI